MTNNIFEKIQANSDKELIEVLLQNENIKVERIVSYGFPTPENFWYNQDRNEWVILLNGEAEIEYKNAEKIRLKAGDYLMIPSHKEHRVNYTSQEPQSIWLCFYFK